MWFVVIDGQHIDHLDHSEIYNSVNASQSSAEETEEQKQQNVHQDEFILKHLFQKSGLDVVFFLLILMVEMTIFKVKTGYTITR